MRNQRSFSQEFKRHAVEELLSGESRPAQLCRRHNISSSLLYHWKRQYSWGKFNNEPTEEAALKDRIEKLEQLVTLETLRSRYYLLSTVTISCSSPRHDLYIINMPIFPEATDLCPELNLKVAWHATTKVIFIQIDAYINPAVFFRS